MKHLVKVCKSKYSMCPPPPQMVFMNILGSVPFESLENLLYMKYSICLWERGMVGGPLKTVGFRLVLHIPLKERRTQMENHGTHSHMVC